MNLPAATSTDFVDLRLKSASIPSHGLRFWYLYHTSGFSKLNVVARYLRNHLPLSIVTNQSLFSRKIIDFEDHIKPA
jgi:hypothetical protein